MISDSAIILYQSPLAPLDIKEGKHYIGMLLNGEIVTSHHHLWELEAARDAEAVADRSLGLIPCGCMSALEIMSLEVKPSRSQSALDQFQALPDAERLAYARSAAADMAMELEVYSWQVGKGSRGQKFVRPTKRTISRCRAVSMWLPVLATGLHIRNYSRVSPDLWEEVDRRTS